MSFSAKTKNNLKSTEFLRHPREYLVTSCVFKKVSSAKIKLPYFSVCVNFWAFQLKQKNNFKSREFLRHPREYFVTSCVFKKVSSAKIKVPYFSVCVHFWAFQLKQKTVSKVQNFWGTFENILWPLASLKKFHQQRSNFPIFQSVLIFELFS